MTAMDRAIRTASLTATIRRTAQGAGDWLDDLKREDP